MPSVLRAARDGRALAEIQAVLALDYGGIDFGLTAAGGEVLFFEANATYMVVNPFRNPTSRGGTTAARPSTAYLRAVRAVMFLPGAIDG